LTVFGNDGASVRRFMKWASLLALALCGCSSKTMEQGGAGDSSLFVPPELPHDVTAGEDTDLTLVALTLVKGPTGSSELYAAVRNDGTLPICEPGMLTNFFDDTGALLGSAGITLQAAQFYALDDGTVIRCVSPGDTVMGGASTLPAGIVITELGRVEYAFPAFSMNGLTPVPGPTVTRLQAIRTLNGTAYAGTYTNALDLPADATVSIFPTNAAGRPLGMATARAVEQVQPGDSWSFETNTVRDPGVSEAVYPGN
jgi:hypothetical protein